MENRSKDIQREAQGRKMDGKYEKLCANVGHSEKGLACFNIVPRG